MNRKPRHIPAVSKKKKAQILFYLEQIIKRCKNYVTRDKHKNLKSFIELTKDLVAWSLTSDAVKRFDVTFTKFDNYKACVFNGTGLVHINTPDKVMRTAELLYTECLKCVEYRLDVILSRSPSPNVWYVNTKHGSFFLSQTKHREPDDDGMCIAIAPYFALHPGYVAAVASLIGPNQYREDCSQRHTKYPADNVKTFIRKVEQEIILKAAF